MKIYSIKKFAVLCFTMIVIQCVLSSCVFFQVQYYSYYSDESNYVTVTGTVDNINYYESDYVFSSQKKSLIITVKDMDYSKFSDNGFEIAGDNYAIVIENGIEEKLEVGSQIEFVTAPRYFGDGYIMPIIALSIEGEEVLDYETGYNNLLESIKDGTY